MEATGALDGLARDDLEAIDEAICAAFEQAESALCSLHEAARAGPSAAAGPGLSYQSRVVQELQRLCDEYQLHGDAARVLTAVTTTNPHLTHRGGDALFTLDVVSSTKYFDSGLLLAALACSAASPLWLNCADLSALTCFLAEAAGLRGSLLRLSPGPGSKLLHLQPGQRSLGRLGAAETLDSHTVAVVQTLDGERLVLDPSYVVNAEGGLRVRAPMPVADYLKELLLPRSHEGVLAWRAQLAHHPAELPAIDTALLDAIRAAWGSTTIRLGSHRLRLKGVRDFTLFELGRSMAETYWEDEKQGLSARWRIQVVWGPAHPTEVDTPDLTPGIDDLGALLGDPWLWNKPRVVDYTTTKPVRVLMSASYSGVENAAPNNAKAEELKDASEALAQALAESGHPGKTSDGHWTL